MESTLKNEGIQDKQETLKSIDILRFVAEQTNTLLSKIWRPIGLHKLNQFYVSKLQLKGLANYSGRINWTELIPAFNRFFGKEMLEELQSYIEPSTESTWLHKLLRKPRVTCHPLRHLLVLCFLGETVESMVNQLTHDKIIYEPFGVGPWPCLNKAASHFRSLEITSCKITRDSKTGLPVGTFSCSCGFVYSRKGPDQSNADQYKIGRIKEFGEVWSAKLSILSQLNFSRREMARRLGCDTMTIVNKLSNTSINQTVASPDVEQDSERYKEEWKRLLSNNDKLSVTELRRLNRAAYAWLYRHEKKWLQEHSPSKSKITLSRKRVNWEERDQQTAKEILTAANEILNEQSDKLIRVTKTELGRRISMPQLIFKMLHKLPETARRLEMVMESVEDFQRRRIKLKAEELKGTNMVLKHWKLIRSSGLRDTFIESHREVIDDLTIK
ncbi:TnsD family Tn7-like transposition protein [Paenibacillus sp. YYML68]|uniref:TnsD family Tn7-like transposition protein n=1 Tax=Paenibacillus sp. YYML68 TaxID=2909250 RepID=UPI0024922E64|nr:TnsD family Tn7-like transposition protein [Paenibacillus sp. YYML68]